MKNQDKTGAQAKLPDENKFAYFIRDLLYDAHSGDGCTFEDLTSNIVVIQVRTLHHNEKKPDYTQELEENKEIHELPVDVRVPLLKRKSQINLNKYTEYALNAEGSDYPQNYDLKAMVDYSFFIVRLVQNTHKKPYGFRIYWQGTSHRIRDIEDTRAEADLRN